MLADNLEISDFDLSLLIDFEPKKEFSWDDMEIDLIQNTYDPRMPMRMLLNEGKPIAIIGVNIYRKGIGELWMIPSEKIGAFHLELVKALKWLIDYYIPVMFNILKLQIAIKEGWEQGCKWARTLGFKFEQNCYNYDMEKRNYHVFYKMLEVI